MEAALNKIKIVHPESAEAAADDLAGSGDYLNNLLKTLPVKNACRFAPEILRFSIERAARYFGGSRYRLTEKTRRAVLDAQMEAVTLINPGLSYGIYPIRSVDGNGRIFLENGFSLPAPAYAHTSSPVLLTAAVATLGRNLEARCRELAAEKQLFNSTLLDAVGTTLLESLARETENIVNSISRFLKLFNGQRFSPGLEDYPMQYQTCLMTLSGSAAAGVQLNKSLLMDPVKSVSFFSLLYPSPVKENCENKCTRCSLENCSFRR